MAVNVATGIPPQPAPLADNKGVTTPIWYQFFVQLFVRSGGGSGVDVATVAAAAAAAQTTANAALVQAAASLKKAANLSDLTNQVTARGNLSLGPIATSATVGGWSAPTGGPFSRAAIDGGFTQTSAAAYSQADTQALINQVEALSLALAQLIVDQTTVKTIGP